MKLREPILVKLSKRYAPSQMVPLKYKSKDLLVKTDPNGNPVVAFVGKLQPDGKIKGERYTRTLVRNDDGELIKDHWDLKGKA